MEHIDYKNLFESFNNLNVLILGDVMVDSYIWGEVSRISPEAPVPIVSVSKRENRLGGAANVALNVKAMGANPILCSLVGADAKGDEFIHMLETLGMETQAILKSDTRVTTTKFRVIGNNVQMLRVDEETDKDLNEQDTLQLIAAFEKVLETQDVHVIIFQDYDKGVISADLIDSVVKKAGEKGIPVSVDPKKKNFSNYKGVSLFKPNLKELKEGLNIEFDSKNKVELDNAASTLAEHLKAEMILITLSEDGMLIHHNKNGKHSDVIPSNVRSVSDVSGAGDTVIAVASLCLARDVEAEELAFIANLAGGQVCEHVGVVPVIKDSLLKTLGDLRR